jgi:hypothetical protein
MLRLVRAAVALCLAAAAGCAEPAPPLAIAPPVMVVEIAAHASAPAEPSCAQGTRWNESEMACVEVAARRDPAPARNDEPQPIDTTVMGVLFDPCAQIASPTVAVSNCDPLQGMDLAASDAGVVRREDAD